MISVQKNVIFIWSLNAFLVIAIILVGWQIKEIKTTLAAQNLQLVGEGVLSSENQGLSLEKIQADQQLLSGVFLSASTTVPFLERVEETAKQTKVSLKINQAETKTDLHLNLSVTGNFAAVNQFLIAVEQFPYALRLKRLDLKKLNNKLWQLDLFLIIALEE